MVTPIGAGSAAGDLIVFNGTSWIVLSVNATATRKFVRSVSGATALDTLTTADLPSFIPSGTTPTGDITTTTTNPSWADVTGCTVAVTVPSGWDLLMMAKGVCASTDQAENVRLVYGAGDTEVDRIYLPYSATLRFPFSLLGVITGLSGSQTAKMQFNRDAASGTAKVTSCVIRVHAVPH